MRLIITLIVLLTAATTAHATCFSPETCTSDSATLYLGGAPWDVTCRLEDASWDPQVQSYTCIAHSQSLDISGGVGYVEMEYATTTSSDGAVWPTLPNWITYWWPTKQSATSQLTAWSMANDIWTLQDARITWTYYNCSYGRCEGFINYDLDPGAYYIYCSWYWTEGQILPNVTCRVGQGSMR